MKRRDRHYAGTLLAVLATATSSVAQSASVGGSATSGAARAMSAGDQAAGGASAVDPAVFVANVGNAGAGNAGAIGAGGAAAQTEAKPAPNTCTEVIPTGKSRPRMKDSFPRRGKAGYALTLEVEIEHGKAETVMPGGFEIQKDAPASKVLSREGFILPDGSGPAAPSVEPFSDGERSGSKVRIPFLALPKKPGRAELTLPSLPIVISRASGELLTVCTSEHAVTVEEPTANQPHATPQGNPTPRRQLEEWTAAKNATIGGLAALLLAALTFWLVRLWRRRPKVAPPPPPPRPPWEVALEELYAIRHAGLIEEQRFAEHFDRVSHAVRDYLGRRFGFDGLESTTRETLRLLEQVRPAPPLDGVTAFLRHADLVKFAKVTPTEEECLQALSRGDQIVRQTMPTAPQFADGPSPAASEKDAS